MRRLHWPKFKAPRNCRKQSFMNVCSSGNGTAGVRTFACACACGSQYLLLRGGYYLQAAADIENDWVGSCSNLKTSPFRVWRFCGARDKVQRRFKGSRTFPEPLILISFFFCPGTRTRDLTMVGQGVSTLPPPTKNFAFERVLSFC